MTGGTCASLRNTGLERKFTLFEVELNEVLIDSYNITYGRWRSVRDQGSSRPTTPVFCEVKLVMKSGWFGGSNVWLI